MSTSGRNGGFCGALQRAPPPLPSGLARRLSNKENYSIGRVKVMLRVTGRPDEGETPSFITVDKKKRQVTLLDPSTGNVVTLASQERGPMVSAPKMFAFDSLFTSEDQQVDVCASALSEVIPAVLEGYDGCLLSLGYPNSGQFKTMLGTVNSANDLGAIPCAISWLYKGINERRQKSGARFSVRVSAVGISATKPESPSTDLLAAHATDSDNSPGMYLRDDFLGGPTELRAPTAERAALFLDAALACRPQSNLEPAMIFTLHVYQYSLSGKGGVAGGRSRLHLIDLGGCANRNGGLPLSGIGNILLAILSGQRHPPNKDHPLTPLLKDCLSPMTCHVTVLAQISHNQTHADALTTIQLASRIHRMRRRKHRFVLPSDKMFGVNNAVHQASASSEGPDPSSSDLSADTVIYMGPLDDATDGEHPPVYLPSLGSGDNRCAMNKALKGSVIEKTVKNPVKKGVQKTQNPVVMHRLVSGKMPNARTSSPNPVYDLSPQHFNAVQSPSKVMLPSQSPKAGSSVLRHTSVNKASNFPTPKGSPRRTNMQNPDSPMRQISEEQWIDGPRVSRSKVAEARHLLREINHVKQCETWIDGPKSQASKTLTASNLQTNGILHSASYGFMDNHKKSMIRQWVENQSTHVFHHSASVMHQNQTHLQHPPLPSQSQTISDQLRTPTYHLTQVRRTSDDDQNTFEDNPEHIHNSNTAELSNVVLKDNNSIGSPIRSKHQQSINDETDLHSETLELVSNAQKYFDTQEEEDQDQDSGPSEVPPALPLIDSQRSIGSREMSLENLHRSLSRQVSSEALSLSNQQNVQMMDCGLQVSEEDIARTMSDHPLSALSQADMSVISSHHINDALSDCVIGDRTRNQFDQLARLREIYTSQLAMAEVIPSFVTNDSISVYSEPTFRFNAGSASVCSEPAYHPPSPNGDWLESHNLLNISRTPSQTSLPSLKGIMTIATMEQYASLRHPDGASDTSLQKEERPLLKDKEDCEEKPEGQPKITKPDSILKNFNAEPPMASQKPISQLPLLPLTASEAYDSGHDSLTPRTSKHSGISRRAESGYHSVATARDSDESSCTSGISKDHNKIFKKKRQEKSLCNWLRSPFTCAYPETEGEISDF